MQVFNLYQLERQKKIQKKNKEQVYSGYLYLVYTIDQPFAHVCIKLQLCRPHRKLWQKFNVLEFERKKSEEIKE